MTHDRESLTHVAGRRYSRSQRDATQLECSPTAQAITEEPEAALPDRTRNSIGRWMALTYVVPALLALAGCGSEDAPARGSPRATVYWVTKNGGSLVISYFGATWKEIDAFDELPNEEFLILSVRLQDQSKLDNTGFQTLTGYWSVKELDFQGSAVSDDGLVRLGPLENLDRMSLARTDVTDAGLQHIAKFTKLTFLDLSETDLTDDGLDALLPMWKLQELDLSDTSVSSIGILKLATLTNLTKLHLRNTKVLDSAVKELKESLKYCTILREAETEESADSEELADTEKDGREQQ